MPVGRGIDRDHRLAQEQFRGGSQAHHRQVGPHLHDRIDIVAIDFADRLPAHGVGGMRNQHRAGTPQAHIAHHGKAAVLVKVSHLLVGHREIGRQERDAPGLVDIQGCFGGEGTAGNADTGTLAHHGQVLVGSGTAIPEGRRRHAHHHVVHFTRLEYVDRLQGGFVDARHQFQEAFVVADRIVRYRNAAVVIGHPAHPQIVEIGLYDGVGGRSQHAEFLAVAQVVAHDLSPFMTCLLS